MKNHHEIPVINLGPYLENAPRAAEETAERLRWVQEKIGFYYLINHGVSADLIQKALKQVRLFHSQPLKEKLKLKVDEEEPFLIEVPNTIGMKSRGERIDTYELLKSFAGVMTDINDARLK